MQVTQPIQATSVMKHEVEEEKSPSPASADATEGAYSTLTFIPIKELL